MADPRIGRLISLISAASRPPPGAGRIALALGMGLLCHTLFAAAVLAMMVAMFSELSRSLGTASGLWAVEANAALILQFPLVHSLLLTRRGGQWLTFKEFSIAMLTFLRDEVPANWHEWCDQVTDNFRVIDPKEFQIIG